MTFQTIRHAQQQIWPRVRESIDIRRAQREAVARNPTGATTAATARARIPHNRMVADEAVWAIAKENLLASPEQQAVVKAAQAWAKVTADEYEMVELQDDERALYDAVQALASSLADMDDIEVLTPADISA